MKKIEAIIRSEKMLDIKNALALGARSRKARAVSTARWKEFTT